MSTKDAVSGSFITGGSPYHDITKIQEHSLNNVPKQQQKRQGKQAWTTG
jgi:hypothetical protein